ncbi:hypothetical protein [Paeniglutamicibacter cryotolerans]|uniref:Uncharacterized protein n=1 Tax=Paeniglutamicibacter cryotolerans TaxID=670079 RepID=A0A839QHY7_9MICC|nr:hypothetical protein [Paeniglutamicibacter cryotolerans]MBB2995387.1 hypothetical protein [Paeniglutamicibacter cryotolerans]
MNRTVRGQRGGALCPFSRRGDGKRVTANFAAFGCEISERETFAYQIADPHRAQGGFAVDAIGFLLAVGMAVLASTHIAGNLERGCLMVLDGDSLTAAMLSQGLLHGSLASIRIPLHLASALSLWLASLMRLTTY